MVFKIIFGVVKGMDYKLGNIFILGLNYYIWNVVLLNGVWELVDMWFVKWLVLVGVIGGFSM